MSDDEGEGGVAEEGELDAGRVRSIAERERAVDAALARSDIEGAVRAALENPPLGTKSEAIKARGGRGTI